MGLTLFLLLVGIIFGAAAAWARWEENTGRAYERTMWHKVKRICLDIAVVLLTAWLLTLCAHYVLGIRVIVVAQNQVAR